MQTAQNRKKYGRTYHLDFSPGMTQDDKRIKSLDRFWNKKYVVTEKMDGENTTLYDFGFHARSVDSAHNFTRNWIKLLHENIKKDIPPGWRFCGENTSYYHSLEYDNLESFFYLFSIWDDQGFRLPWSEMEQWAQVLDLAMPKILKKGIFTANTLDELKELSKNLDTSKTEGFVVTLEESFHEDDFSDCMVKWVRAGHVQPNSDNGEVTHWLKNTHPLKLKDPLNVKPAYMPGVIYHK